jgi:hypothetical protein
VDLFSNKFTDISNIAVNDVNDDDDVTCMIDYTSRQPELGNILYP